MQPEIALTEYESKDCELPPQVIRNLVALEQYVSVSPTMQSGWYQVKASSYVGFARLADDLTLSIAPKVGVDTLFALLAAVYDSKENIFGDDVQPYDNIEDLFEFVVEIFTKHVESLIARGLLKGYRSNTDELVILRGQIGFAATIARRPGLYDRHLCTHRRFTHDVLENRILRWAAYCLRMGAYKKSSDLSTRLNRIFQTLGQVLLTEVTPGLFDELAFDRLNEAYRPALHLGRLLLDNLTFTGAAGRSPFLTYMVNMNTLFEKYVGTVLRPRVREIGLHLAAPDTQPLDVGARFEIKPDFVLYQGSQPLLVMDTKYKTELKREDIYQKRSD